MSALWAVISQGCVCHGVSGCRGCGVGVGDW